MRSIFMLFCLVFFLLIVGCNGNNPQTPPDLLKNTTEQQLPSGLTAQKPDSVSSDNHYLWAYAQIYYDPDSNTTEIIPFRETSMHWNVLKFLEQGPCTNCVQVINIADSGYGTVLFTVRIKHPFANPNFTGFDVRGIAMFAGSKTFPGFKLTTPDRLKGDGELINAEGYTTLYNSSTIGAGPDGLQGYLKGKYAYPIAPDAKLNGYKKHISADTANTRNAFYAGTSIDVIYELDTPDGPFIFGYAVDASWEKPLKKPVTNPMTDFGPGANCPEPWKIQVTQQPIGDGLTTIGGATKLLIDVYDWQGKNSYQKPKIECPEIFTGLLQASWKEDGSNYSRYEITISNDLHAPEGQYECLIGVVDNENDPVGKPWLDLTAYQIVTLPVVVPSNLPPIAKAAAEPLIQTVCEPVHFFDNGSSDPDGTIVKYEWDWNGDGIFDQEGSDLYNTFNVPGTYYVQMKVTDNMGATDTLDEPLEIQILNAPPTAKAKASNTNVIINYNITFDGSESTDNDCNGQLIKKWEWDWENDGIFDSTGAILTHSYSSPGVYYVQLRVTDDEGGTDLLDTPIKITVVLQYLKPVAYAKAEPKNPIVCEQVHFMDDGSYDPDGGQIMLYEWDYNGDGTYDAQGPDNFYSYSKPGSYSVMFRVTDDEGEMDTLDEWIWIHVKNALPTAVASANKYVADIGELLQFDGSGSYDNDCGGQKIVQWGWDWDNNGSFEQTGEYALHSFSTPGDHYVQLGVLDDEGGADKLDQPLKIEVKSKPFAAAKATPNPQIVCEPVQFTDNGSYDPDGGLITKYEWDWNNDGIFDEEGKTVSHTWTTVGTFYVQFRVTDDEGATSTLAVPLSVQIINAKPTASAMADKYNTIVNDPITFNGSFSQDNDCNNQSIVKYQWDWTNDGIFDDTGAIVSHAYSAPGIYYVQLRVTDDEGGTDLLDTPLKITITGVNMPPVAIANRSPNPQIVCAPVHFYNDGSFDPDGGLITQYEWDWNNDGIFDAVGPEKFYSWNIPGTYSIQFRVTDDENMTDILDVPLKVNIINAAPTAVAEANKYQAAVGEQIIFNALGSVDNDCDGALIVNWEWDWDNNGIYDDSGQIISHSFSQPGIKYVQLRVTDDEGGYDLLNSPLVITIQ